MTIPSTNLFRAEKATLLIWLVFFAMSFAGDLIKPTAMGSSMSWLMLGSIFGVMLSAVFRVVQHAECLAAFVTLQSPISKNFFRAMAGRALGVGSPPFPGQNPYLDR